MKSSRIASSNEQMLAYHHTMQSLEVSQASQLLLLEISSSTVILETQCKPNSKRIISHYTKSVPSPFKNYLAAIKAMIKNLVSFPNPSFIP